MKIQQINRTTHLQLTEVKVYGQGATGINVAYEKSSNMSTPWDATTTSEKATDGNPDASVAVASYVRTR